RRAKRPRDREALRRRVAARGRPAGAVIPVVGIGEVAFDPMQPGMHPRAVAVGPGLYELMRGLPVAAPAVPQGEQRRRGAYRRRPGVEAGFEGGIRQVRHDRPLYSDPVAAVRKWRLRGPSGRFRIEGHRMDWFERLTGFPEGDYAGTQAALRTDGDHLV